MGDPAFWQGPVVIPAIAAIVAVLVGCAVALGLRRPSRRAVRLRIGSYAPVAAAGDEGGAGGGGDRRGRLRRSRWWTSYEAAVALSRSERSPVELMRLAGLLAVPVAAVVVLLTHVIWLAALPLLACPFVERWRTGRAAQRQRDAFIDALPSYMQDMASAIRIGRSFIAAMAVVAAGADEPTRSELERAVADEALGRPLEQSLLAVAQRMQSPDFAQIALIAELNRRSGSNVAEALDRVAEGARDRADLHREVRALTAQAKLSSSVLTGLPVVLAIGMTLVAPSYAHPLFHTLFGIVSVVFALLLIVAGWKVMKRISTVEV